MQGKSNLLLTLKDGLIWPKRGRATSGAERTLIWPRADLGLI
jgi:hypothetical protein